MTLLYQALTHLHGQVAEGRGLVRSAYLEQIRLPAYAYAGATASASSSTSTGMPLDLYG